MGFRGNCERTNNSPLCSQEDTESEKMLVQILGYILPEDTLIRMCEELWPPSSESKLPGRPADSQLEQISTESQMAQWNLAPTISSRQLYDMKLITCGKH